MIGAVLLSILPTAIACVALSRTGLIKSVLLRFAFAWFLGQYVSTIVVFGLATVLALATPQVLLKATIVWIDLLVIALLVKVPPVAGLRASRNFLAAAPRAGNAPRSSSGFFLPGLCAHAKAGPNPGNHCRPLPSD